VPPDSVRCTTGQCPVHQGTSARTLHLRENQRALRYNSPDCPVCQRSNDYFARNDRLQPHSMRYSARRSQSTRGWRTGPVRCTTGQPSGPQVRTSTVEPQRSADVAGAPDCPARHATAAFQRPFLVVGVINTPTTPHS
jgi:hypothetical protein